ncbi:hypothetical protein O181_099428 [Austropuccinia psidii MF-1]|uniref:Integrase catalytic domain-containing protein n=1 Tax=Austropuccinia psidii MF-1 TaxID=1389203 RepID=A0A9Q3PF45_9BASI|nr:hypothetical protein [Austropuccinia psidii MF-1]
MNHLPFKSHFTPTTKPLDSLHMDLIGPISPPSNSGHCYILTIMDQHTSFKITSFLKNKSYTYKEFFKQQKLIENIQNQKIKQLVTDGGREFVNQQFKDLANQHGFNHTIAPLYTPEHNGIAERENRTILDKAQCLLLTSNLPYQYFMEAINTATFLTNILPTPSKKNLSPCFLWTTQLPKIKRIQTFGFGTIQKKKIEHSSLESCLPPSARCIKIIGPQHPTLINSKIREENILPYSCCPTAFLAEADHLTYNQVINSKDHEHWLKEIAKELQNMTELNICKEVTVKEDFKLIGTTRVFETKRNELNQIIKHKACLCAQVFSQTQGKDYSKTFAPTRWLNSLRTLI